MRTLAIDLGTKRVGLALSDQGGRFATPYEVLTVSSPDQALAGVLVVVQKEGVERIVLGLPLNMDNTAGPAVKSTLAWGKILAAKSSLPILYVDERLSSFAAEQTLLDRKKSGEKLTRKSKKQQQDALAAASFLQQFLDGQLKPIDENRIAASSDLSDNF